MSFVKYGKGKRKITLICCLVMIGLLVCMAGCGKKEVEEIDPVKNAKEDIFVGYNSLNDYVIVKGEGYKGKSCDELNEYLAKSGIKQLPILAKPDENAFGITLQVDAELGKMRDIKIENGEIMLIADSPEHLSDAVKLFANVYLGWIKAGTEDEHISNKNKELHIPENTLDQEPWIAQREPIVTLWNVNWTRGTYMNIAVSTKNQIVYFTEDQIYEYVKMMKFCGFNGIQATDMCSAWAGLGSYEAVHEKLRMMADAAHSMDMKFTLWVWGSEFTDCGWSDPTAVYGGKDFVYSHENSEAVATFDKYYSIYAELADCTDRVIAHYYDPGHLNQSEDVAFFAKMLCDKFKAVNPDVDFGVSCWVDVFDKDILISTLGNDITLYENGYRDNPAGTYNEFRADLQEYGCRLGTWAWNTCEMEIDQLAQMNFNLNHIRNVYKTAREYDPVMKPEYWSEMDSYHILNAFSLYCAGQMLIDPDIESEELYTNLCTAAVGPEYANDFAEMLDLIQTARTGDRYDTFFWSRQDYVLKSEDYPGTLILDRCNRYIPILQEMIDKNIESYSMPFPISLHDVLSLMLPHLQQIKEFAEFRLGFAKLEADYEAGADEEDIKAQIEVLAKPIPSYNTIVGSWGQIEARAQYEMLSAFGKETGYEIPEDPAFHFTRKMHVYMLHVSNQLGRPAARVTGATYSHLWSGFGEEDYRALVMELVDEGLLTMTSSGDIYLTNWEDYIYNVSM